MRLKRKYVGSTKLGSCSGVEVLVGVLCQGFRMLKKRLLGALPTHPTTHTRPLARMQHGPPGLRRDFHRIALLPAMGARVVLIVNRGWHTNP
jgi:hypothetical protein